MFGDGHLAACKPISEEDLAAFMADCVMDRSKANQVCAKYICGSNIRSRDFALIGAIKRAAMCSNYLATARCTRVSTFLCFLIVYLALIVLSE